MISNYRLRLGVLMLATVTAAGAAVSAGASASHKYAFTTSHPPLMKNLRAPPIDLPESYLEQVVGKASWQKPGRGCGLFGTQNGVTNITVSRTQIWALTDIPQRYAVDETTKVTTVTGYSTTEKVTFANTIEGSVTAEFFGLSANVQDSLKLTQETDRAWTEAETHEKDVTWKAGNWYASWNLIDALSATKVLTCGRHPTDQVSSEFKVILLNYDDSATDREIGSENFVPGAFITRAPSIIRPLGPSN